MSKKTFMATIIIIVFLVSLVAGMQACNVKANPFAHQIPPSSPITEPPKITVESPSNITYHSQDALLSFALTGCNLMLPYPNNGPFYHLTSVSYELDGQKQYLSFSATQDNQTFSAILTGLPDGNHVVTVFVEATSVYATNIVSEGGYNYQYQTNFYHPQASETINFTIDSPNQLANPILTSMPTLLTAPNSTPTSSPSPIQQPTIEPSQAPNRLQIKDLPPVIVPASMIFLAIVGMALLIYFVRRKGVK